MLKGLEDPPPHVYYALCTTNPDKLLKTILTRCTQFRVHPLDEDEMVRLLRRVASGEGAEVPRAALQKIAEASGGSARTALNALQKMIADPEAGEAAMATAELTEARALDLFRALIGNRGWRAVRATLADLKASGEDPEGIRRYVLACCSNELLRSDEGDRAAVILDEFREPLYSTGFPGLVFAAYSAVRQG